MLTLVTAPAALISAVDIRAHLRVDTSDEDVLFDNYIAAATAFLDGPNGALNQAIGSQVWLWKTDCFASPLRLPFGPVTAIGYVKYLDPDGVEQTVSTADYYAFEDARGPYVKLVDTASWPDTSTRDDAVRVQFTAGMATVPADIKQFIRIMVAEQHLHREIGVSEKTFPANFDAAEWFRRHRRVF